MSRAWNRQRLYGLLPSRYVLSRGDPRKGCLYLSFDDGPHPEVTPRMLDLLAGHGAKATFFLVGTEVERHPALVRRMLAEGHAIGNHSYSHPWFGRLGLAAQREEIARMETLLQEFDPGRHHAFRAPRGELPLRLLLDCMRRGLQIAGWSRDTLDYADHAPQWLADRLRGAPPRAGDILLLHDDHPRSLALLRMLLPEWRGQGLGLRALPAASA